MERGASACTVDVLHGRHVQLLNDLNDESCPMMFREPVVHRRRKQVVHVTFDGLESVHNVISNLNSVRLKMGVLH